jgi:hypothetical protein
MSEPASDPAPDVDEEYRARIDRIIAAQRDILDELAD